MAVKLHYLWNLSLAKLKKGEIINICLKVVGALISPSLLLCRHNTGTALELGAFFVQNDL